MKEKSKKSRKNKDFVEIYGIHAVLAALKNSKRIQKKLFISCNLQDKFTNLERKVSEITSVSNKKFSKIFGNKKKHCYIPVRPCIRFWYFQNHTKQNPHYSQQNT